MVKEDAQSRNLRNQICHLLHDAAGADTEGLQRGLQDFSEYLHHAVDKLSSTGQPQNAIDMKMLNLYFRCEDRAIMCAVPSADNFFSHLLRVQLRDHTMLATFMTRAFYASSPALAKLSRNMLPLTFASC